VFVLGDPDAGLSPKVLGKERGTGMMNMSAAAPSVLPLMGLLRDLWSHDGTLLES